jgi:hypothetical protein
VTYKRKPRQYCRIILYYLLSELSRGAADCAAIQELPSILWNPKVHYHVHKSPPLVPILSHINPIHTIPSYLRSILVLFTHLLLGLPSGLVPSGFLTYILYAFLLSHIRATFPSHLTLLELIILIILGEEYKFLIKITIQKVKQILRVPCAVRCYDVFLVFLHVF